MAAEIAEENDLKSSMKENIVMKMASENIEI